MALTPVRRAILGGLLAAAILYCLYFLGLAATGLLGPDEPRYAAIGREMARSGDWVTPRLWGEPWFEKPALIYWMSGLAFRAGLSEDLAPRLPVALLSVAFLLAYYGLLKRQFAPRAALFATAMLGTSAAWLSMSHVGVTDLPMAAAFSAAMLLWMPLVTDRRNRLSHNAAAGALLGLAVLAKGLVPLALALPLAFAARRRWRELLAPGATAAFLLVAAPWYGLCWKANGWPFIEEFFVKHHLSRFSTETLQHQQPFWFYGPVLLAGLFPWTPLAWLLFRRRSFQDPRRRFLLLWAVFGLLFFSASVNKLPGYLLPVVPALCALLGLQLSEGPPRRWLLAACGLLLALLPVAAAVLPEALLEGLRRAQAAPIRWGGAAPAVAAAGLAWWLETRGRRAWAVSVIVALMTAGVVWVKVTTFPELDRVASARVLWRQISRQASEVCVEEANRGWLYGLNYYAVTPLPACTEEARPVRLRQTPAFTRLDRNPEAP